MPESHRHKAFGLNWSADIALGGFSVAPETVDAPDVVVVEGEGPPPDRGEGVRINRGVIYPDGVRFLVDDEAVLDMFRGDRIEWRRGPSWTGVLPLPFFSTVTAMLMAWHGAIPIHGSAVEIDGRGVIVCGKAGFGKSSLSAGLVAAGARLVSDDLSVVMLDGDAAHLLPGRPAVRLHPNTARFLPAEAIERASDTSEPKTLVYPRRVADDARILLDMMVVLTRALSGDSRLHAGPLLLAQTFRPAWSATLPNARDQRAQLAHLAARLRIVEMIPPAITDQASFEAAAAALLAAIS